MASTKNNPVKIAIAGAGGIGGFVTSALYDYGVNRGQYDFAGMQIDLYDDDTVDTGNLLHQNFTEADLGQQKAKLLADRYFVNAVTRFMTKEDFSKYDLVFSCVDSMTFRKELYEYGWDHPELYWIDGRCNSRNIGIYNSKLGKKTLEPTLSDSTERKGCLLAVDKTNKVSHITPQVVASIMMQEFLNYLRGEPTMNAILLYI